jgi:hypothetical protein
MSHPSSGLKSKPNKKPSWSRQQAYSSEMSVCFLRTTWRYTPEEITLKKQGVSEVSKKSTCYLLIWNRKFVKHDLTWSHLLGFMCLNGSRDVSGTGRVPGESDHYIRRLKFPDNDWVNKDINTVLEIVPCPKHILHTHNLSEIFSIPVSHAICLLLH